MSVLRLAGLLVAVLHAAPPTAGHVLILDNDRTLEGDVDLVSQHYRVRREQGETMVPASRVRRLCADLEEAYLYLRARANLEDPDERLRLARWCQTRGLRAQGLVEITAALKLRPGNLESQRLLQVLQRTDQPSAPPPAVPKPLPEAEAACAPLDFNTEAIGLYVTRVQPILMNTCACCHAAGKGGAFKLTRTFDQARTHPKATQQNLTAVLAQVLRDRPRASPLLTHAVAAHGNADLPPLQGRETAAYRTLEEWVLLALRVPEAKKPLPTAAAPIDPPANAFDRLMGLPATKPAAAPFAESAPEPKSPIPAKPASETPARSGVRSPETGFGSQKSTRPPAEATDEFDPAIFNQQMHPPAAPKR